MVTSGEHRYVAKLVPNGMRGQFEAGLAAAELLTASGIDAGAPVRTIDGGLSFPAGDGVLGLLRFVLGRPLDRDDPVDQQWWGDRLGAAHHILLGFTHPGIPAWHWVRPSADYLDVEPWVRPAVANAVEMLDKLQVTDRLTFGTLNGDPYYGAFLLDPNLGRIGIIDWGSIVTGPLVYDVASAVMYAGGVGRAADFLQAYAATGAVPQAEIDAALPTLLHFRWAVQANFFAARVVGDPNEENLRGLADARAALSGGTPQVS